MVDVALLKQKISDSGMTVTAFAEKSGILRETLYNRFEKPDFKASEIARICAVLNLDRDVRDLIFFKMNSELNSTYDTNQGEEVKKK